MSEEQASNEDKVVDADIIDTPTNNTLDQNKTKPYWKVTPRISEVLLACSLFGLSIVLSQFAITDNIFMGAIITVIAFGLAYKWEYIKNE